MSSISGLTPPEDTRDPFAGGNRALVVDDSKLQRRLLSAMLKKWGFEVAEAPGGAEALELAARMRPDFVMSDWIMPGMDGLQFCRRFRGLPMEGYGYFILLTAKSEAGDIAEGLDAGADDFLTKPVNPHELRARLAAGARIIRMQRELSEKNRVIGETLKKLQRAYDVIDRDLIQAKKIQESLVPERSRTFGASRVSLLLKPCGHIGGDLVGMFSPGPNRVAFYGIDVSGHGITSAMMTARLGSYLNATHLDQNVAVEKRFDLYYALRKPTEVAESLNTRLLADAGIDQYFTMAYAIADLRSGLVRMVQAGHPHPLLIRQDGTMEFIGRGGLPVGLLADAAFEQIEFRMKPGDRLLFYSDGLTEARLKTDEMLEGEGLKRLVATCGNDIRGSEFLDDLYWRLISEMDEEAWLDDDVSATLFEFNGP